MSQLGPITAALEEEVTRTLRHIGVQGCIARVATEFGDHPDIATTRMSWALRMIRHAYADSCTPEVFAGPRPARSHA